MVEGRPISWASRRASSRASRRSRKRSSPSSASATRGCAVSAASTRTRAAMCSVSMTRYLISMRALCRFPCGSFAPSTTVRSMATAWSYSSSVNDFSCSTGTAVPARATARRVSSTQRCTRRCRIAASLCDSCHPRGTSGWRRRIQSTRATGRSGRPTRTSGSMHSWCPRRGEDASRLLGVAAALHAGAFPPVEELLGHLAAGLVDHLVAKHHRALAFTRVALGRRLLVRGEEVDGVVKLLLSGREHLVDDLHLVRVQRPLAVVAQDARPHRVVAQRVELADLQVRAVDDLEAVGAAGHEDLREHVVKMVAGVLGDLHAAGEHGHLRRRREVGGAEHDRLEPRRRGADLLHVDQAACRLDLRLERDPALAAYGLIDLGGY